MKIVLVLVAIVAAVLLFFKLAHLWFRKSGGWEDEYDGERWMMPKKPEKKDHEHF